MSQAKVVDTKPTAIALCQRDRYLASHFSDADQKSPNSN